ncbi:MAG: sulfatase [Myxococcales bacterium]|nr:sulfatase [Myxococcales bacterium]
MTFANHLRSLPLLLPLLLVACDGGGSASSGTAPSSKPASTAAASGSAAAPTVTAMAAEPKPAKRQPLNVLLITIDSMRYDMPWAGYDKDIAPHLTALAAESVQYTRAYTISSFTSKSVGGLLGGKYPSTLYRGPTFFTTYSKANVFFPELLQEAGVQTLAAHAHLYFDRGKNLRQGFSDWRMVEGLKWNAETDESVTSDKLTPLAIQMLDQAGPKGPFFMWLHYMDPHDKYVQHEEGPNFGRRARNLYDNEVWYTDHWVNELLEHCKKQPWWDKTALIVSSDHGEAFGEHDMWKHAFALWEVLTHVPLMFKIPGVAPRKIDARRSHIDLAPTILDLMGQKPSPDFVGRSMAPELFGEAEPDDREPILLDLPVDSYNPNTKAAIKGDFKIIREPLDKYKLYDLSKDPDEKHNLATDPKHAEDFARMKEVLDQAWAKHPPIEPYGPGRLSDKSTPNGPMGPPGWKDPDG